MNGIDISKHQRSFNARTARAMGMEAVILRHAYGTSPDSLAVSWAPAATAQGLKLGGYGFATWHYKSLNGGSASMARRLMIAQVSKWKELAKDSGAGWWFAIDQELEAGQVMGLGMRDNTALINEAASLLQDAGLKPCLYCSAAWDFSYISTADLAVPYWMARYHDGTADFGDKGADLAQLPSGKYTDWMRKLLAAGRLVGWQFASTGLGAKYGVGSESVDRNVFYADPKGFSVGVFAPVQAKSEAAFVALGPVSKGDANTILLLLSNLSIGYTTTLQDNGLETIVTKVACSTGDQAKLIGQAVQLGIPVQLLSAEEADKLTGKEEAPATEGPAEGYSVVFLGLAVKGGFASQSEAVEYIEAVLGKDAMERLGIRVEVQ